MIARTTFLTILILGFGASYLKTIQPGRTNYLGLSDKYTEEASAGFGRLGYLVNSEGGNVVTAISPECMVRIAPSQADGDNDAVFSRAFSQDADIVFLFQGRNYPSRPNFMIFVGQLKARIGGIIGVEWKLGPIWAVSISRICDVTSRNQIGDVLNGIRE